MTTDAKADDARSPDAAEVETGNRRTKLIRGWLRTLAPIVLAFLGSFLLGGVLIAVSGQNPFEAYGAILHGAVGNSYNIAATVARAMPIVGAGIAAGLAFKAGLFNIGGEGQLVLGGLCAILVALFLPLPGLPVVVLALLVAMLIGGLWALLSGWFETQFNVPILVSSLLMNFLAAGFASYMVNFPLIEPGGARSQSAMIAEGTRLPRIVQGSSLSAGLFLIIAVVVLSTFVLRRTSSGYELRIFGANPEFAVTGGVNPVRLTLMTMFFSGLIAGLTGAIQVLGVHYRLIDRALIGPGHAWTGVMAAILADNNPMGIVAAGLFFAAIQTGASGMERLTDVPFELSFVVQAIMILLVASRESFRRVQRRDDV